MSFMFYLGVSWQREVLTENQECETWYVKTVTRQHDGRYVVWLPVNLVLPSVILS